MWQDAADQRIPRASRGELGSGGEVAGIERAGLALLQLERPQGRLVDDDIEGEAGAAEAPRVVGRTGAAKDEHGIVGAVDRETGGRVEGDGAIDSAQRAALELQGRRLAFYTT